MDPLTLDVPEELTTDRLILRAPREGDAAEINAAIHESIEALKPWMPWATPVPTVEQTAAYSRRKWGEFVLREMLDYRIYLKDGGTYAGNLGLFKLDWKVRSAEIGYWLRSSLCGRGYMTEAVGSLTEMAMEVLNCRRVQICMDDRNERSRHVAERLGFHLEGVLRRDSLAPDGSVRDTRVYAKIRDEK